jgi:hypothetical protein
MYVRVEENIGKYTGGGKMVGRCGDGRNIRIVISHSS